MCRAHLSLEAGSRAFCASIPIHLGMMHQHTNSLPQKKIKPVPNSNETTGSSHHVFHLLQVFVVIELKSRIPRPEPTSKSSEAGPIHALAALLPRALVSPNPPPHQLAILVLTLEHPT